jgi:hypothetical protein
MLLLTGSMIHLSFSVSLLSLHKIWHGVEDITALRIVEEEISEHERMLDVDNGQNAEYIEERLKHLRRIRRELMGEKKKYEENDIILRDIHVGAELPISGRGENYREFELPDNRVMRIRLLHPSVADRITGADVIYEHYANDKKRVRIAAIQYKMWGGETLYITGKIKNQLQRLQQTFCEHQCCQIHPHQNGMYRLPCCAAFLRPTDELQVADNKLVSSGYHIPVCRVTALWEETQRSGKKLTWRGFRSESISYRVFEELFNTDMLGSRWLEPGELEAIYREHKILEFDESLDDRLLMHVQTY